MTEYHEPKNRAELIAHYRGVKSRLSKGVPPIKALPPLPEDATYLEKEMFSLFNIMRAAANECSVSTREMREKNRRSDICYARQIYCAVSLRLTYASRTRIGHLVNLSHHSTVIHADRKVERTPEMEEVVARIVKRLDPTGEKAEAVAAARAAQAFGSNCIPRVPQINLPPDNTGGLSPKKEG